MNVIIPMSGASLYEKTDELVYPKVLTEVAGKTLLEHSMSPFLKADNASKLIYVLPKKERKLLSLDAIIKIVSNETPVSIVDLDGKTAGALCTCMMAVDHLDMDQELIISSADHYFEDNLDEILDFYRAAEADAGVLSFLSVHPKWSYAILDETDQVMQTSEKTPISKNAMAGFFYFKKAEYFFEAAKNVIRKQNQINGAYFVSSTLNEMILNNQKVISKPLSDNIYHSFYDAHSIKAFENTITQKDRQIEDRTREYVHAFHQQDLEKILSFFRADATLVDPNVSLKGVESIEKFLKELFESIGDLSFIEKDIIATTDKSVIEFELIIDGKKLLGADVIHWDSGQIVSLDAYLY